MGRLGIIRIVGDQMKLLEKSWAIMLVMVNNM